MRTFLGGLAVCLTMLFAGAAPAAADTIECPLTQARREITTSLPSGWWQTPIVNNLTNTRVQDIGGRPALVCEYGPAGSVQRQAPPRQTCAARRGGFDCHGGIVPGPLPPRPGGGGGGGPGGGGRTLSSGTIDVPQTYQFDLENGRVGSSGDVWFHAVREGEFYLEASGGARIAAPDRADRGYGGCSRASFSTTAIPLTPLLVGSYICVRTNEGNVSQVHIISLGRRMPRALRVDYVTWR